MQELYVDIVQYIYHSVINVQYSSSHIFLTTSIVFTKFMELRVVVYPIVCRKISDRQQNLFVLTQVSIDK